MYSANTATYVFSVVSVKRLDEQMVSSHIVESRCIISPFTRDDRKKSVITISVVSTEGSNA